MVDAKPVKQSIALAVTSEDADWGSGIGRVLLVRRPEDDNEFPGMWGLPAASCHPGETLLEAAERAGRQKLGAPVEVVTALATGVQQRPGYTLEMTLFHARLAGREPQLDREPGAAGSGGEGVTFYTEWRWGLPEELRESAENGSLCSRLLLDNRLFPDNRESRQV